MMMMMMMTIMTASNLCNIQHCHLNENKTGIQYHYWPTVNLSVGMRLAFSTTTGQQSILVWE